MGMCGSEIVSIMIILCQDGKRENRNLKIL
ncbi:hypothetical protein HMPREF9455_00427 [Dysgonomonas gadei ATCC BAA-286]|uniref:Uncharacterized protein n=1 Tax=Dysgonomonas gadei ATCC BAA-286 TaxID=742766 RepID=F5ITL0_9BACT|nr:hypothetical protein HMPREF9455_00427 [Dysgonomonas gadei ATCC BAA-286]